MLKKVMLLSYALCATLTVFTQQITPTVISSAGDISKTNKLSLEWTLGEPVIETIAASDQMITQGFHQPFLFVKQAAVNDVVQQLNVLIIPNPVQLRCRAFIKRQTNAPLHVELANIEGRKLYTSVSKLKDDIIDLDFSSFRSGTYILTIRDADGGLVKTFKIIKAL